MKPSLRRILSGMLGVLLASAPATVAAAQVGIGGPPEKDQPPVERPRDDSAAREASKEKPAKPDDSTRESAAGRISRDRDVEAAEARREALLRINARGTRVRIGGDVLVDEHERLGEVVAIFGRADVRGIVAGDLVTVGGDVHLGPKALVRGDIIAIGGVVHAEDGSFIGGKVSEMNLSASDFRLWLPDDGEVTIAFQPDWPRIARLTFVSGIMRNLFWFVICAVLLVIAPGAVTRVRQQAGASPIAAFAVGFVAEILFLPVMLLLALVLSISIIGVPLLALLPVLGLVFVLAIVIGFTGIASGVGAQLVGRATPLAALVLGLTLIWGTGMAGRYLWTMANGRFGWGVALLVLGYVVEFAVCTLGLGAALLAWSSSRRPRAATAPAAPVVSDVDPLPQGF